MRDGMPPPRNNAQDEMSRLNAKHRREEIRDMIAYTCYRVVCSALGTGIALVIYHALS